MRINKNQKQKIKNELNTITALFLNAVISENTNIYCYIKLNVRAHELESTIYKYNKKNQKRC